MSLPDALRSRIADQRRQQRIFLALATFLSLALYTGIYFLLSWLTRSWWGEDVGTGLATGMTLALLAFVILWGFITTRRTYRELELDAESRSDRTILDWIGTLLTGFPLTGYQRSLFTLAMVALQFIVSVPAHLILEIRRALGWAPRELPLEIEATVVQVLEHYREHGRLPRAGELEGTALEGVSPLQLDRSLELLVRLDLLQATPGEPPHPTFALDEFVESA